MNTTTSNLRDLFEAVVELAPAARPAFLDEHCADPSLRARLQAMLHADASADEPVSNRQVQHLAHSIGAGEADALPAGSRIGPFEIVRVIGEGGSSTVFEAQRDLEGASQRVALKLLRQNLLSPEARRRFGREQRALIQMQHPHIARMIEGGVTAQGSAYIALELVEGVPITDYAAAHALGMRERLQLFATVCRAVDAAHRALIVHRDLKPSNVLVTPEGEVKLLDFGIAKLLADEAESETVLPAFTPAYASPEQVDGGAITTATDVYALGVVLGELFTGRRLRSDDHRLPSAQVDATDRGLLPGTAEPARRALRGDLDNIIRMAIDPVPERRYASAGALADDVERMLDGKPVHAHPPSRWYRARKFLRRHRVGAGFAAILAATILAALGVSLWQTRVAKQEQARADAMRDFMVGAFVEAEPGAPRDGPPRITEVAEKAIAHARRDAGMDESVRTELLSELGAMLRHQGRLQASRETLQENYDRARAAFGDDAALTISAGYELGQSLVSVGELDAARALDDRLLASPAAGDDVRRRLLQLSALVSTRRHDRARGVADANAAVALARKDPDSAYLAETLSYLSTAQLDAGDVRGAIATGEQQLALHVAQRGAGHVSVATAHATLSRAYRRAGNLDAAQRHILAALQIDKAVLGPDDWRVSRHLNALVVLRVEQRDFDAALAAAREALRIDRIAYGDEHAQVAEDLATIGAIALKAEDPADALPPLREWMRRFGDAAAGAAADVAGTRIDYAIALVRNGEYPSGIGELHRAIAALESAPDVSASDRVAAYAKLAALQLDFDAAAEAAAALDKLDAALAAAPAADASESAQAAVLRARACLQLHRAADARAALDRASAIAATDPVVRAEARLLSAQAAWQLHDADAAARFANLGNADLAALRSPPSRLARLAAEMNRRLDAASSP